MITKIGNNFNLNFRANKPNKNTEDNNITKLLTAPNRDTFTFKGRKADKTGPEDFPKDIGICGISEIHIKAHQVADEVYELFKRGEYTEEDGSRVQIINSKSQIMYEYSPDIEATRISTFKDKKLQEVRMPMQSNDGRKREMIIKLYEDGETIKLFEIKRGTKSGEGTIETMLTFDENGHISSFIG